MSLSVDFWRCHTCNNILEIRICFGNCGSVMWDNNLENSTFIYSLIYRHRIQGTCLSLSIYLYMCLYPSVYIHIHTHTHTHIYIYIYIYIYIIRYLYYIYIYIYIYISYFHSIPLFPFSRTKCLSTQSSTTKPQLRHQQNKTPYVALFLLRDTCQSLFLHIECLKNPCHQMWPIRLVPKCLWNNH